MDANRMSKLALQYQPKKRRNIGCQKKVLKNFPLAFKEQAVGQTLQFS